ncbi:MAG: sigma-70 family RNA polymerase sigma factor [Chitinophagaceae bacterium]
MDKNTLRNIIIACKKNDRLAQEKLYRSFFGLFYTIAKDYVADRDLVTGIINEAFLKIFTNIDAFDEKKGSFEGWGKRILQNVCIDTYRKEKSKPFVDEITDEEAQYYFSEQHHSKIFHEDILVVFDKLPETTQKVCKLFLLQGYSHKEIGQMMDINEATSRWHLMEGKKRLKDLLKDQYGTT